MDKFLAVDKRLLGTGLHPIDILLIAQIQEFERANKCFVTNQQFANWFGVSIRTIDRSLAKLEALGYINRNTKTVGDNGQRSKQRTIDSKGSVKMTCASDKVTSNCQEGNDNLSKSKRQNDTIKDNLKDNKKDNSIDREFKDLSNWELDDICKGLKIGETYVSLAKKYNLRPGSITSDFHQVAANIKKDRAYIAEQKADAERRKNDTIIDFNRIAKPKSEVKIDISQMLEELCEM